MKKKTDKAKTEEELFREQQNDLLKFARELRKEEERKERRHLDIEPGYALLIAYHEIKDRKCTVINGSFVKEEK